VSDGPRILVLDIETSPAEVYVWGLYKQDIGISQIIEPTRVICLVAKWVGEDQVFFFGEDELTHREVVQRAFDLLDQADAVVTFNGDNFDIPHLNREFLEEGLGRPAPFQSIDLYKVVKKHHRFLSNKLAWITERLELSGKMKHEGFELWRKCLAKDPIAWASMRAYNKQDVLTTEELYRELLVWIDNHPNMNLFRPPGDVPVCPKCGQDSLQKRGSRKTKVSVFQRYQCQSCGAWSSTGKRLQGADVR
jgi:DNA polymerase elongation subunit (family B)